jgi:hypothetical protein
MGLTTYLAENAGITIKKIGSLELIALKDADAFLRAAKYRNVAILGIEGFRLEANRAIPDMGLIADFSGIPYDDEIVNTTIEEAARFLLGVSSPDVYFDFTLDEVTSKSDGDVVR